VAFGFRNGSSEFFGSIDSEDDSLMTVCQRSVRRVTVGGTTGEFRDFGYKSLIFITPVDNDFLSIHQSSSPKPYPYIEHEDILEALSYTAWRAEEIEVSLAS
jgi:hypothetical protein